MSDITKLVQEAVQAFEKVVPEKSLEPVLNSLRNIKAAWQESGLKPENFVVAKGLREASDYIINFQKSDKEAFSLYYGSRSDKVEIEKVIQAKVPDGGFYADLERDLVGILL